MFCGFRHGFDCLRDGRVGTLTPLIPLSPRIEVRGRLRAFKGEGERRTEAEAVASATASASSSILERGEGMRAKKGERVMEGLIDLRRKSATPVPMRGVRPKGRFSSASILRQPHTSERMWTRREKLSLWGGLDHQKCSTTPRDGSGDP